MIKYIQILLVASLCLWGAIVSAKTAEVHYEYSGPSTDTVAILVSDQGPDFHETLEHGATITGAIDGDKDYIVHISNLVPGKTYYFRAVAWDINNVKTPYSDVYSVDIPIDGIPFNVVELPLQAIEGQTLSITISVK